MSSTVIHETHDSGAIGARIGMWLFLFTEFLLFGGLFLTYAVYRHAYAADFHYAATTLNVLIGSLNTLILLTSSLTMALSIAALERGLRRLAVVFLSVTVAFGVLFLVNKIVEWTAKFHHGLYPGAQELAQHPPGEIIFYGLYFMMTGLHGLHVIIGVVVLVSMMGILARKPRLKVRVEGLDTEGLSLQSADGQALWSERYPEKPETVEMAVVFRENDQVRESQITKLTNCGLYWHMVDVIWIFLFPLFYLIT
jgi:cytochrome c oxidase subunit 3